MNPSYILSFIEVFILFMVILTKYHSVIDVFVSQKESNSVESFDCVLSLSFKLKCRKLKTVADQPENESSETLLLVSY